MDKDYREIIRDGLVKRISLNSRYSLRAYARDTGISFGQLSLFLNGKKGISPLMAEKIFRVLGLNDDELKFYLLQVTKDYARSAKHREKANRDLIVAQTYSSVRLTEDAFQVIAEWYHFAILQSFSLEGMLKAKTIEFQIRFLEKSLGITKIEVECAVDRLIRLKLLEKRKSLLRIVHETVITSNGVPSAAIRSFHAQVLKKALVALEMQNVDERYASTILLPIRKKDFSNIKNEASRFQEKIMTKYGRAVQKDGETVYAFAQQFFKISED